ncbi:MAG: hypothetical protein PVI90_06235 [Desulfobacteraceae bacterium]|jgi:hypothetical protein
MGKKLIGGNMRFQKKINIIYIIIAGLIIFTFGINISFAEDNINDSNVGCDGDDNPPITDEDGDEAYMDITPTIGAGKYYTDAECQKIYGIAFESCGGNCYRTSAATCANPKTGLICVNPLVGCPEFFQNATACFNPYYCDCIGGKVDCN